jgi:nitric oxide synthase oxygenase domain/subunit
MKWLTMLLLTFVFVGCAHQYNDRGVSSVDEESQQKQHQKFRMSETFGGRY